MKKIVVIILSILLLGIIITLLVVRNNHLKTTLQKQEKLEQEIRSHYNEYVMTNKEAPLYERNDKKWTKTGTVGKGQALTLDAKEITYEDEYLKVSTFEKEYYVYYKDLDVIEKIEKPDERYKKYIVFNKNIKTKETTSFYDEEGNLIYTLKESFDLPIIIKKENQYGVEFNNQLVYVKKEDVEKETDSENTKETNTKGIAVLNYHFFYDETKQSEINDCNQIICMSKSNFSKHLDYIKDNHIFTPTMREYEMYLDGEINLPKSVLITIDDGWRIQIGTDLLEKYQLNGTVFLITSWWKDLNWLAKSNYVEYHSHGDNLHKGGDCPGGQGGAIKCLAKDKLVADLNLSRQKLSGSTVFCYPFYEYNDYSIATLKEVGFTMAFAGGMKKSYPGVDKYQIPRYVIYDSTSVNTLKQYIG